VSDPGDTPQSCYEIEFPLAGLDPAAVDDALFELGASSITLADRGDEPVLEPGPGEIRLWSDTLVRALFPLPHDDAVLADSVRCLGALAARFGEHITETARVRHVGARLAHRLEGDAFRSAAMGLPDRRRSAAGS